MEKVFFKTLQNWQENRPCKFIKKETPTQALSCEFCESFEKTIFLEQLLWLLLGTNIPPMLLSKLLTIRCWKRWENLPKYFAILVHFFVFLLKIWDKLLMQPCRFAFLYFYLKLAVFNMLFLCNFVHLRKLKSRKEKWLSVATKTIPKGILPANIYLLKFSNRKTRKNVKNVQS